MQKKNDVVKKDVHNAKINIEDKIPDITNLITKTTLNAKINEIKEKYQVLITQLLLLLLRQLKIKYLMLAIQSKKLTITQKLMKLQRKLLIIVMINTLLLQNLIS